MITVYFDGKCGLCSKEIRTYQSQAPDGIFYWHDIATHPEHLDQLGISQEAALRRLHATDHTGRLHIGVDAFILIWQHLRYWKILAFFGKWPVINQLAHIAYNRFADYRFKKLPHCQIYVE